MCRIHRDGHRVVAVLVVVEVEVLAVEALLLVARQKQLAVVPRGQCRSGGV